MERYLFFGGDARMRLAAELLSREAPVTRLWMEGCPCPTGEALREAARGTTTAVLPIPALDQAGRIRCAVSVPAPHWQTLCACLPEDCLLCGGGLERVAWPRVADLLREEQFALANAVPTALASAFFQSEIGRASITRCGTDNRKVTPPSGSASASSVPPIRRISCRAWDRPSPVPPP